MEKIERANTCAIEEDSVIVEDNKTGKNLKDQNSRALEENYTESSKKLKYVTVVEKNMQQTAVNEKR